MDPIPTVALGIKLDLVSTADGGRTNPLSGGWEPGKGFWYRPNWGLPGWPYGDQTAAPVLGFSKTNVQPGEHCRAVIVALFPVEVPAWRDVAVGDELRMYEGSRICGRGAVAWTEPVTWRLVDEDENRLAAWLSE